MPNFSVTNSTAMGGGLTQAATTTSFLPLITVANSYNITSVQLVGLGSSFYRRGKVYDLLVGTISAPGDQTMEWDIVTSVIGCTTAAFTAGGISSLSSTFALDPADNTGSACTIAINTTGGNTASPTVEKWYVGVNQRASYRWVAAPGSEILYPANSSASVNGVVMRVKSGTGYTGLTTANLLYQEQ